MRDVNAGLLPLLLAALLLPAACSVRDSDGHGPQPDYRDVPLRSSIQNVQPMTGIVLWNDNRLSSRDFIQLEYSYVGYDEVATEADPESWSWARVERILASAASHRHQAILRFFDTYPGRATAVPAFLKRLPDYRETRARSEGLWTFFPDWSHPAWQGFVQEFFRRFAARYDRDPRLAFLQAGFGLWAEYHVYDPGEELGVNFPSKAFQAEFFRVLESSCPTLRWSISIDAADESRAPFAASPELRQIPFGLFDDSFLCRDHGGYNHDCFEFFGREKRLRAPVGGEFSYYSDHDQRHALDPSGPYGVSFEEMAAQYNVSYMIGDGQPAYQTAERIRQAGMAVGYRFRVTAFQAAAASARVTVENRGIAPIYYDAWVAVNGVRAEESLKGLCPGENKVFTVGSGGDAPALTIECDRLVAGQRIEFEADLD
ncbi:MAG TPA: DUF4832 domain-containing protein [Candidatus Aminicenantes bacterium]|nr:DUF4832 domain-containing protein [Candidatus Aminicenantes bacterium]